MSWDLFNQPVRRPVKKARETRDAAFASVFHEENQGPGLGHRQQAVYDLLQSYPKGLSNSEVASILGWSINRVTPRTLELRERGLVVPAEKRECTVTKSFVQTWRAK